MPTFMLIPMWTKARQWIATNVESNLRLSASIPSSWISFRMKIWTKMTTRMNSEKQKAESSRQQKKVSRAVGVEVLCLLPPAFCLLPSRLVSRPALPQRHPTRTFDPDRVKLAVVPLFFRRIESQDISRRNFFGDRAKQRS